MPPSKRNLKILNASFFAFWLISFIYSIYSYKESALIRDLPRENNIVFAVLANGTQNFAPKKFGAWIIYYEKKTETLKILSINPDAAVIKKTGKSAGFKDNFNSLLIKDREAAVSGFFKDLDAAFDGAINVDYFVNFSYLDLSKFLNSDKKTQNLLAANTLSGDAELVNQLKLARGFLNFLKRNTLLSIFKTVENYSALKTNISRLSFISMIMRFKFKDAKIIFYEMPVRKTFRLEPDKQDISYFLKNIYFAPVNFEPMSKDGFIEIQNASLKARTAYNAAMFLREMGYDVLDWGNSQHIYDETIIKEYKGDYGYAESLAAIFKTKNIINSYQGQTYYKTSIYIGKQGFDL